jgi:tRNA-2-methylthio-N6-dimethylallyladenosine synthase
MVGRTMRVLVEGPSKNGGTELAGRAGNTRTVLFDGGDAGASLRGRMVDVKITESLSYSLRGELV